MKIHLKYICLIYIVLSITLITGCMEEENRGDKDIKNVQNQSMNQTTNITQITEEENITKITKEQAINITKQTREVQNFLDDHPEANVTVIEKDCWCLLCDLIKAQPKVNVTCECKNCSSREGYLVIYIAKSGGGSVGNRKIYGKYISVAVDKSNGSIFSKYYRKLNKYEYGCFRDFDCRSGFDTCGCSYVCINKWYGGAPTCDRECCVTTCAITDDNETKYCFNPCENLTEPECVCHKGKCVDREKVPDECTQDTDCGVGGCNNQICGPKDDVKNITTSCEMIPEYNCVEKTNCACIDKRCQWNETQEYAKCMDDVAFWLYYGE